MDKETKEELNSLARMVKIGFDEINDKMDKGFAQIDGRFKQIDGRFTQIDGRFEHIEARLSNIEQDISEIKKHFVYRYEFEDLMARVKYLEGKLGVESGK